MNNDEWIIKNFKAIKQSLERAVISDSDRQTEIKQLRESITMIIQENQVLKQRMSLLQAGQVLGSTSND